MQLAAYLAARGESLGSFAIRLSRRLGKHVPRQSVHLIARRNTCRVNMARAIIAESRAEPAPDGATVTLEDLVGTEGGAE